MRVGRTSRTVLSLVVAGAGVLWLISSSGLLAPDLSTARDEHVDSADLGAEAESAPGLEGRAGAVPRVSQGEDGPERPADDWTIVIEEILGPDGKVVRGADVLLDHLGSSDATLSWEGEPLRIRLRRFASEEDTPAEREDMPVYRAGEPVYLSIYHDDFARWFTPPLRCPPGRTSTFRVRLTSRRTLSGTVRDQDGNCSRASRFQHVRLTRAGVPGAVYSEDVSVDETGAFVFTPDDDIPSGSLVLTAGSHRPAHEGYAVSVEVAADENEVALVLRPAHTFRFRVSFGEEEGTRDLGARAVTFRPEVPRSNQPPRAEQGPSARTAFHRTYAVTRDPVRPIKRRWTALFPIILPEGPSEQWHVDVPGYRTETLLLDPSGPQRHHDLHVRLHPAAESGLLIVDVMIPPSHRASELKLTAGLSPDLPVHEQQVAKWHAAGESQSRRAIRLPSGQRLECQILPAPLSDGPWLVMPFRVELVAGQSHVQRAKITQGGYVVATRRAVGGRMPELSVRLRQGTWERGRAFWFLNRDLELGRVYATAPMIAAAGRCEVGLTRAGRPLGRSQVVIVEKGKTTRVHLPDVETIK